MKFPDNIQDLIEESIGSDDAILEIVMVDPYNELSQNFLAWTIEKIDSNKIDLQFKFEEPLDVSQDYEPDQIFFNIKMGTWESELGNRLPELVVKARDVPRQFASLDQAGFI